MSELTGRVVAITGPAEASDPLARALEREDASVVRWPTIGFEGPAEPDRLRSAVTQLRDFDWITFTSPRAVASVVGAGARPADTLLVAAVGRSTAERLRNEGWPTHVVGGGGAVELASAMVSERPLRGARVLFPAGSLAGTGLQEALAREGAFVERVEAYRTRRLRVDPSAIAVDLDRGVDVVTFASPSAVESLAQGLGERWSEVLGRCAVAAIGPTTRAALIARGALPDRVVTASCPDPECLAGAAVRAVATKPSRRSAGGESLNVGART